ncbi:unnamed protein product [Candidula unifasciata]|uniref:High-affinity choline transporter 1 n=1 Tax=Candidula unifasciata TaxID=100452 RepID=A0A8S3Z5C0_9EUPU|nr:unnamed protein product [Candidula unifasciata]
MEINIPGLVSIIVFYIIILVIGIWAARKSRMATNLSTEDVWLANRSLGVFIGVFTTTATWVGGGYINGTTEVVAHDGLVWCQAPIGYSISLIFGGMFFAEKMRVTGFTTMLDPFHWKFGDFINCLLFIPALTGEIFWSASILASLGATLKVILGISLEIAIIVSAVIALLYTIVGGLYSVAYTDVVQLICIFVGLWVCVPFSMTHEATTPITANNSATWLGHLDNNYIGNYIDYWLLLIFGGIPWQELWQRVLSSRSTAVAKNLSYISGFFCLVMAVPAVLMGAVAASTDWNMTEYGHPAILKEDRTLTLALVMRYLCPTAVTFIGLGAVSAAVMSSTDAAILSASCMFSRNVYAVIYNRIKKTRPSETSQVWVMRVAQIAVAAMACAMALTVNSIYYLFLLCSDFIYVILFPQLVCVLYIKKSNSYGSLMSFIVGPFLPANGRRKGTDTQLFPFRTLAMIIALFTLIAVSYFTDFLFTRQIVHRKWDLYGCFEVNICRHVSYLYMALSYQLVS